MGQIAELYRSVYDLISALSERVDFPYELGSQTRLKIAEMKTSNLRFALIVMLLAISVAAVSQENFLREDVNRSILELQEEADSDFTKGHFGPALRVYQQELAPVGDKYAQYMVGYMYLAGKGVQEDAILASAWYRLAAQRNTEQYARIRDSLLTLFNDEQRSRSDQLYIDLRREMGDLVLVEKLIRGDIRILSRSRGTTISLQGVDGRASGSFSKQLDAMNAAVDRIASRTEFLSRQMISESTLDQSERNALTELLDDARREVEIYKARH